MELPEDLPLGEELLKKGSIVIKPVMPGMYVLLEKEELREHLTLEKANNNKPLPQPPLAQQPKPIQSPPLNPKLETQNPKPETPKYPLGPAYWEVRKKGYAILQNQDDAFRASKDASEDIKSGRILGTRAFDGKYYICTRYFYKVNSVQVKQFFKDGALSVEKLCQLAKLDENAMCVLLNIMLAEGELIETKKGVYSLS